MLMVYAGLDYGQLAQTPPRVLDNLLAYLTQTEGYRQKPKPGLMDRTDIRPAELRQIVASQQGRRSR